MNEAIDSCVAVLKNVMKMQSCSVFEETVAREWSIHGYKRTFVKTKSVARMWTSIEFNVELSTVKMRILQQVHR